MTRELDIRYRELCRKCKKRLIESNRYLIMRMLDRDSYRTVEKLTGIPKETLRTIRHPEYLNRKSVSTYIRTSRNKPTDTENIRKRKKIIMESSKNEGKSGHKRGVKKSPLEKTGGFYSEN